MGPLGGHRFKHLCIAKFCKDLREGEAPAEPPIYGSAGASPSLLTNSLRKLAGKMFTAVS